MPSYSVRLHKLNQFVTTGNHSIALCACKRVERCILCYGVPSAHKIITTIMITTTVIIFIIPMAATTAESALTPPQLTWLSEASKSSCCCSTCTHQPTNPRRNQFARTPSTIHASRLIIRVCRYFSIEESGSILREGFREYRQVGLTCTSFPMLMLLLLLLLLLLIRAQDLWNIIDLTIICGIWVTLPSRPPVAFSHPPSLTRGRRRCSV